MEALPPSVSQLPEHGSLNAPPEPQRRRAARAPEPDRPAGALLGFFANASLFLLMLACVAAAWLAQAYYFHVSGDLPDGRSKPFYVLLGGWGINRVLSMTPAQAFRLYVGAVAAFGVLAAFIHRRALKSPSYLPALEIGSAAAPAPRCRPAPARAALLLLGLLGLGGGVVFLLFFTHASARADVFLNPDSALKTYELFLKRFYAALGYVARPNTFWPFYAWIGAAIGGAGVVWLAGRLWGLPWSSPLAVPSGHPPRRLWEWIVLSAWIVGATACYLWGSATLPYSLHQSEALIGLGAKILAEKSFAASVFDNVIQPSTCFVHRAAAVAFVGPTLTAQRLATAVASGTGMIFGFLALRSFVAFLPAFLTMMIFSFCAVTLHYSRTGLDNLEAMYWIMLTLWIFHGAESAAPGAGRNVKYYAAGWAAGGSFGQFTGAPLVAVIIGLMLALRFFFQRSRRGLLLELSLFAAGFLVAFSPFAMNPGPVLLRQDKISIFRADILPGIFTGPEAQAHPAASFPMLLAIRTLTSALGFFSVRDYVGEFGSTYPFSGPLLSALALLGASVLVLRFRSWHAVWTVTLFGLGAFLGGAILFGPHPPSSARLLMLMPAVLASAATAVQLMFDCFCAALKHLRAWSGGRRLAPGLWLAAGIGLGGWAVGADMYNNVSMYLQICRDPRVIFNFDMLSTTEIYRFFQKYPLFPIRNYQYLVEKWADQTFSYNDYLNPNLKTGSVPMGSGAYPTPGELPPGLIMFLVQRCDPQKDDLKEVMKRFPGGRLTHTEPEDPAGDDWHYYIYLYKNSVTKARIAELRAAELLAAAPPAAVYADAPTSPTIPAAVTADAPTSPTIPAAVTADAPTSPTLPGATTP